MLVYWLGRDVVSGTVRANALVFFLFTTGLSGVLLARAGIFTIDVLALAATLLPVYGLGLLVGGRLFGRASESLYRRVAYAAILFVAVVSMPVFG